MAERKWTAAQTAAIGSRERNIIVSAAAGSGKTATLTERIIRLICGEPHADISKMLIVTFTKAAAAELRERISSALSAAAKAAPDDAYIREQLSLVGSAEMSTIDSFCLSIVRPMFAEAGLAADFRVGDETELSSMRCEAMEEAVSFFYDTEGGDETDGFFALADALGGSRNEDLLDEELLSFERAVESYGIGSDELRRSADELEAACGKDFLSTRYGSVILRTIADAAGHYADAAADLADRMCADECMKDKYVPAAIEMSEYCKRLKAAADAGDCDAVRSLCLEGAPTTHISLKSENHSDDSLYFKEIRKKLSELLKKINAEYLSADPKLTADVMKATALVCRAAASLIDRFRNNYTYLKRRRGVVSFSDLSQIASSLVLSPDGTLTPYGESVADRYTHVFIDEYQDTNDLQDRIFAAVASKCGKFLVGDIKQSIYGFRGAEPSVFAGYRERWQEGDGGQAIFMSKNFRSSAPVIDFANAVSRYMFRFGQIPFSDDDLLRCGRGDDAEPCEVCIVPYSAEKGETVDRVAIEAEYVAKRIRAMIDAGTRPEDIAILMRQVSGGKSEKFAAALARRGIPVKSETTQPLFERPEILFFVCVLRAADNPMRDTYLAGAMCSAAFGFTLGDIAVLKKLFPAEFLWHSVKAAADSKDGAAEQAQLIAKCRAFRTFEDELSTAAVTLDCAAVIDRLRNMPQIRTALMAEAAGAPAIDEFYELARRRGGSLFDFLGYISSAGSEIASVGGTSSLGVSIMTIHKSKGLEFPVCFIALTNSAQNSSDKRRSILIERGYGPSLKLCDSTGLVRCDNILRRTALLRRESESAAEDMRILYVAMTRAREQLIVTCTDKDPDGLLARCRMNSRYASAYSVPRENYIETILSALCTFGGSFAKIRVEADRASSDGITAAAPAQETDDGKAQKLADLLRERLSFRYPADFLRGIPSKLTISKLYPEILDEDDTSAALPEENDEPEISVPAFIRGTAYSPADAGSAAHLILQFCNFEKLRHNGVGAELCRLRDAGFLSDAEAEAANLDYIEKFRRSEFFDRILNAKEVRREFRFNALIPAHTLTGDPERAKLLKAAGTSVTAQGVIDIVFTDADGRLVLADYKTDRLTDYELRHRDAAGEKLWNRHRRQLGYYALVCEGLFGRRPDEVLIYSMPLGDTLADAK